MHVCKLKSFMNLRPKKHWKAYLLKCISRDNHINDGVLMLINKAVYVNSQAVCNADP